MSELTPPQINRKLDLQAWWITSTLIAINVGLFLWQILSGVDASNPAPADAIRWGADFAPLTYLEQPQRLITSMFFHFGFIHLALNMWALYIFGSLAEQILRRFYFIGLYFLAGLMGSLLSGYITIQNSYELMNHFNSPAELQSSLIPHIAAGASGAVMGLGGALTILAFFPPLPSQRFILDKKALLIVMGINLVFGFMATGINNSAHIGGMIMGAFLVLIWYFFQKVNARMLGNLIGLVSGSIVCVIFYQYCIRLLPPITPLWQTILSQMNHQLGL